MNSKQIQDPNSAFGRELVFSRCLRFESGDHSVFASLRVLGVRVAVRGLGV